jgi:ABC-type glycerol-3-phosphate transport system permease component
LLYVLGLLDSVAGLILPASVSFFGILLYQRAMAAVPDDLLDAARLDGCGEFQVYWRVALPAVRPTTAAFCLIGFVATWNGFLWPSVVLYTHERYTLPIGLNQLVGAYREDYGALMAGVFVSVIPSMVLFLAFWGSFAQAMGVARKG